MRTPPPAPFGAALSNSRRYVMDDDYLMMLLDPNGKYKIDYVVHGDDPCIVDGKVACLSGPRCSPGAERC